MKNGTAPAIVVDSREKKSRSEGRITTIADVFDALTSVRPYKKAWPVEDAVKLIQRKAGTSFDPELVKKFVAILPEILAVREKYSDTHHVGL